MTMHTIAACLFFSLAVGTVLLVASGPAASAERCEAKILETLSAAGIQQGDVKSIKVTRAGGGGKSPTNSSYDAWIRLNSCSGYLMVSMTRSCHIQQTYTKGDCQVSGMQSY